MEPVFDINKICRVCLEEGILLSIYSNEYAISPLDMIVSCTNVKVKISSDFITVHFSIIFSTFILDYRRRR